MCDFIRAASLAILTCVLGCAPSSDQSFRVVAMEPGAEARLLAHLGVEMRTFVIEYVGPPTEFTAEWLISKGDEQVETVPLAVELGAGAAAGRRVRLSATVGQPAIADRRIALPASLQFGEHVVHFVIPCEGGRLVPGGGFETGGYAEMGEAAALWGRSFGIWEAGDQLDGDSAPSSQASVLSLRLRIAKRACGDRPRCTRRSVSD